MNFLKEVTTKDLQEELERRKRILPAMIDADKMDFDPLMAVCGEYIKHLASDDYHININGPNDYQVRRKCLDLQGTILENALTTFYGDDIWFWINPSDD